VMTTDLMMVQALVRGLMKFVVKEFLSARFVGYSADADQA
jgi:hypothetical protein